MATLRSLLDQEDALRVELRRVRRQIQAMKRSERSVSKPLKAKPKSVKDKLQARELSYTVARQRGLI